MLTFLDLLLYFFVVVNINIGFTSLTFFPMNLTFIKELLN